MPDYSDTPNNNIDSKANSSSAMPSRRKHQRHASAIKATVYTNTTFRVTATITNISYEGLQLTIDKTSAEQLLQSSTHSDHHQHTRLSTEFVVNNQQGQPSAIHTLCRIIHIEKTEHQYVIGLEHRDIEVGVMALSEFIILQTDTD